MKKNLIAYPDRASESTLALLLALPLVVDHIDFILSLALSLRNGWVTDSQASVSYPFTSIYLASTLTVSLPLTLGVGRPLNGEGMVASRKL